MKTVVGLFDTNAQAQKAAQDLEAAGIPRNDISLIASNASETYGRNPTDTTTVRTDDRAHAAATDAGVGAVIGGAIGLLAGASLFIIPGLGWLAGIGWLAGLVEGAAAGAVVGGLIGVLVHIGVPEEEAAYYNEGVRRGGTLMAVKCSDEIASRVAQILGDDGAVNIDERAAQWKQEGFMPTPSTPMTTATTTQTQVRPTPATPPVTTPAATTPIEAKAGETVLPVIEEDIQVGKREVERGGVRVYSHVTQTPVEENVTLREEHVTVDRRPVNRPATPADVNAFKEQTFEVTERAEEPVIAKQARIVEEVVVGKEATERTETVRDTVRRTDVDVEQIPGSEHVSRTAATFESYANDFRRNWQTTYASQGGRYEDYEPSYRYGYALYSNPQYQGKNWSAIESTVQNDWNARYPNTWGRMKNSIRYGFDRAASGNMPGEGSVPGVQTGGHDIDGTPDTRGVTEKIADTVTGDRIDDKTGKPVR